MTEKAHQSSEGEVIGTLEGGCHCGAVSFTAILRHPIDALYCNCSICRMTGYKHINIAHCDVNIEDPEKCLQIYRFGTKQAAHYFCGRCGIKPFYQPRSHPNHWSINGNCVTKGGADDIIYKAFDGSNWEENIHLIRPK